MRPSDFVVLRISSRYFFLSSAVTMFLRIFPVLSMEPLSSNSKSEEATFASLTAFPSVRCCRAPIIRSLLQFAEQMCMGIPRCEVLTRKSSTPSCSLTLVLPVNRRSSRDKPPSSPYLSTRSNERNSASAQASRSVSIEEYEALEIASRSRRYSLITVLRLSSYSKQSLFVGRSFRRVEVIFDIVSSFVRVPSKSRTNAAKDCFGAERVLEGTEAI
mmetsp:Transcript_454/g.660  ORF Transcript_454/g.660 Transcript_454/m.660 type:complete len:216 (+) Transcript_454:432-1079(+)